MSGGNATPRGTGSECRKFAPNIFNKSKCSSCFKQKEEHSAEALECNRATRKISKCGYLFVAPGWDFSNPLNRTKRWQRRWFVLYDDGELTYSVDEHPETVPQARIDMTRVLEVAAAEDVTGHPYSLAVTSPEGVTFVKGTCREETRWWADVLQVYSRNKGRHKRNATFPGGQTTILQVTPTIRSNTPNPPRPRFNSCRSEPRSGSSTSWNPETSSQDLCNSTFGSVTNSSSVSTKSMTVGAKNDSPLPNSTVNGNASSHPENGNVPRPTNLQLSPLRNSPLENGSGHSYANSSVSLPISGNSATHSVGNSSSINVNGGNAIGSTTTTTAGNVAAGISVNTTMVVGSEKPPMVPNDGRTYRDQPASSASPPTRDKLRAEDKARRRMNQHQLNQNQLNQQQGERSTSGGNVETNEKLDDDACRRILLEHEREREGKLRDIAASLTQPRIRRNKPRTSEPTRDVVDAANAAHQDKLIRGDPDGCGLDISGTRYSPTSELRVDLPAEDLLNIKKGWLMKQGLNKEWNKHWFVLRGCGLMYYRDPSTEDKGIMDGVIDLNTVTAVSPVQVARNYGFQTVTWDDRGTTLLSAVTAGIRSSWMSAIRRAANLTDPDNPVDGAIVSCQDSQTDAKPQSPTVSITDRERDSAVPSTPLTPRSVLFSSDEEYRTASEGGRRESGDWSEIPVSPPLSARNGEWSVSVKPANWSDNANHEWSELPPSPPLTRTALSRVKARSRSSSRSRVYKRSRSSPPSSRRSTLDSVRSEDLMMACCELGENDEDQSNGRLSSNNTGNCLTTGNDNPLIVELLESQVTMLRDQLDQNQSRPSTLLVIVERQENEIENLKSQVNVARNEVANAEKEIVRLRNEKAEAAMREKQIDDLLISVRRSEQQRNQDLDDYEKTKKVWARDKETLERKLSETETILRESSDRCDALTDELSSSQRNVEHMENEMRTLRDKLTQGIEENERLYGRMRELEGKTGLSGSRERGRSFDSLSDLTNIDLELDLSGFDKERIMEEFDELRGRFEKAVLEIRAMRKELREAHATQDALELEMFAHKQDASRVAESNDAQAQLMAARIQDLTIKLGASEKQVRTLKQKLTKVETRDKRRSLSLKGRESFQISQELEDKLSELETKIRAIERGKKCPDSGVTVPSGAKESSSNPKKDRKRENKSLDRSRPRRKSLDSATSSEPMKVLIRLSTLETKVSNVVETIVSDVEKDSSECSETSGSGTSEVSREIISRLKKLERVVMKSKRRLEKCLGSTRAEEKAEKCLREVNDILESCLECKKSCQPSARTMESVGATVSRLETILREKMTELTVKRRKLDDANRLDDRAKLELLAERVAFESVVLRQIKRAMGKSRDRSGVLGELVETSHLISNLKCKIRGTKPKIHQNTNYVEYLTRILADKLVIVGGASRTGTSEENEGSFDEASSDVVAAKNETMNYLATKQREANDIVQRWKDTKLRELAEVLAAETLSLCDREELGKHVTSSTSNKLLEDRRIREAWALAQETVNKELVQNEVSHVIMRCGQMYEQNITSASEICLNFEDFGNLSMETWADEARTKLREEIEFSVGELTASYEDSLVRMKKSKTNVSQSQNDSRRLLTDYADVVAHKALIDARIALLNDETTAKRYSVGERSFVSSLIKHEDALAKLTCDDVDDDAFVDAEFVYLYKQFSSDCEDKIAGGGRSKEQLKTVVQSLMSLEDDIANLRTILRDKDENSGRIVARASTTIDDWSDVCEKCNDLRDQMRRLGDCVKNTGCKQCSVLQETIQRLRVQHGEEIETLRRNQERDLMDIKGELDDQRRSLTTQYEQEAASLRERARKLEHRLNAMDSEHSAHVNELRVAYQRSISAELDTDAETRKRYKEEIKQLRGLCEKGLLAMENSHRRIIAEMDEKHRQELENLRVEKEQALSEETQATLAALDAMRKAHEHEVQKEIAKFKQEFIKQMQAREDIGALHKEHERSCLLFRREEMEEIKQEILSLSSKYSSKCVESAALEEKVGSLTKQVAQAQQHIMQLDARNKQLRAHLVLETNDTGINDTIQLLRGRDGEISEQREEIHRLQQQLKHGESRRETVTSGPSKTSPLIRRATSQASQRFSNDESKISRTASVDATFNVESEKSDNHCPYVRKSRSQDATSNNFSYKLERIKSVSLPYNGAIARPGVDVRNELRQSNARRINPEESERNGFSSTLWDSLRQRSGLPQQYQGCSAPMRIGKPGVQWPETEQSKNQQRSEAHTLRANSRCAPRLTPEPSALSVAELMRSPTVRWSGRSCRSLPSTPTPGYPNSLYPPLPAVGMVAERKKRFEL